MVRLFERIWDSFLESNLKIAKVSGTNNLVNELMPGSYQLNGLFPLFKYKPCLSGGATDLRILPADNSTYLKQPKIWEHSFKVLIFYMLSKITCKHFWQ